MTLLAPASGIRHGTLVAAAIILPFAIISLYLLLSRWPDYRFTELGDLAALVISVLSAAVYIWFIGMKVRWRLLALVIVLPALWFGLEMYALYFVCDAFDECL